MFFSFNISILLKGKLNLTIIIIFLINNINSFESMKDD